MKAMLNLDIENGDRHTIVNHCITKPEEVDWLLGELRKILSGMFKQKDPQPLYKKRS